MAEGIRNIQLEGEMKEREGLRDSWAAKARGYVGLFLVTIGAALFLRAFIVEAFRIPSSSMEGTLRAGDFVIVNKFIYGAHTPPRAFFAEIPSLRFP